MGLALNALDIVRRYGNTFIPKHFKLIFAI